MSSAREKLLGQFRELLVERLEKIGRFLMQLEAGPDAEAGKAALRELHGLKGEARMMGFAEINSVVHEMEEVVRVTEKGAYALTRQPAYDRRRPLREVRRSVQAHPLGHRPRCDPRPDFRFR